MVYFSVCFLHFSCRIPFVDNCYGYKVLMKFIFHFFDLSESWRPIRVEYSAGVRFEAFKLLKYREQEDRPKSALCAAYQGRY